MKKTELRTYAKVNLCLDVGELLDNGYHKVEMIMQQILLCDDLSFSWEERPGKGFKVFLSTNRKYLPTDERNLAYKAALLMKEEYGEGREGILKIHIKKRIPVAAGLAGGSSNGAGTLHGLNLLWRLNLSLKELCALGAKLGSDVPFCVMGQATANKETAKLFKGDPLACHCAIATGTGTELKPIKGLDAHIALSKPPISVSTGAVYKGIDDEIITKRPNIEEMARALKVKDWDLIEKNMVNVLENYTLKRYPIVVYTKNKMQEVCNPKRVLMSGSGPSVFAICDSKAEARRVCDEMSKHNKESFWTRTTR